MCGIAGILQFGASGVGASGVGASGVGISGVGTSGRDWSSEIRAMTDAIAHRGPDGEGFHLEPGLALGHRRLAIIDPAHGQQPMYNEDGSVAIVFNGEIYNFESVRRDLTGLGHVFRNRCDTEAIVHAWESWGPDCVHRLSGMFAFALWDAKQQLLFCARDRLGKKPLYYTLDAGRFVFGSEVASLAALSGISRTVRPQAVDDFFAYGYVPEPGTIFEHIHKLPAASTLLLDRSGLPPRIARYWQPVRNTVPCTEADAVPLLQGKLKEAVACRLVSDVPLGAFLSGGVDSSAVVASAAPMLDHPLDTFTIGFDGAEDETPYAVMVAERYGTRQHNDRTAATDMIAGARHQAAVFGEPFGDSSSVPTLTVCRLARQHATVALSGDGGDEVFGGYRRYRWHRLVSGVRDHLPAGLRRHAIGRLAALYPKLDRAPRFLRAKHTLTELSLDSAEGYARTVTRGHADQRHALYSTKLRAQLVGHDPFAPLRTVMQDAHDADPLLQAQLADLATWLPGDILTKVDRASMAASLEVRAPFLDHGLLDWGLSLPAALKLGEGGGKHILKRALEPLLPREILYRTKQGFTSDLAPLFRREAPRVRALLLGPCMLDSGLFDASAVEALLDQHESGRFDHAQLIWLLLAFEGFLAMLDAIPVASPMVEAPASEPASQAA
jgi:asparagine synthase (glutamine-hydrolysing)